MARKQVSNLPGCLITEELLDQAIELARPSCEVVLGSPRSTWGPKWVEGVVLVPSNGVQYTFTLGEKTEWDPSWGDEKDFMEVAYAKAEAALRTGTCTRELVNFAPHLFEEGEYHYVGGVCRDGLAVGVSGAYGEVDEGIASIVRDIVMMLIFLVCRQRDAEKDMQI